jgi:2-keto-4-pentenoate hydratase
MQEAAELLVAVRRAATDKPGALPNSIAPATELEAYRIQTQVQQLLGASVGGWKASMPDPATGFSAPIYKGNVLQSPAFRDDLLHATAATLRYGIEPEIAFTLKHALPPLEGGQYSRAAVLEAIGSAHSAIEICVCRLRDFDAAPWLHRLADSIQNEGLVIGGSVTRWASIDLKQLPLTVQIDGQAVYQGVGGHSLNDPLQPLVWLANHLSARGIGLKAGDVVTTGSCAGIFYATPGQKVRVEFSGLGTATLQF